MKRLPVLGIWILILGACSSPSGPPFKGLAAQADLINSSGYKIGEATFAENTDGPGVVMHLQAWDLPPGVYAMHIHNSGMCDVPDFQTAGGHFNPYGRKHGMKNPDGPHAGDLPNLVVPANGKVDILVTIPEVTLRDGVASLLGPRGTSVVIHANPDDERTDPGGNSGARMACGVIRAPATEIQEIEPK